MSIESIPAEGYAVIALRVRRVPHVDGVAPAIVPGSDAAVPAARLQPGFTRVLIFHDLFDKFS